MKIPFKILIKPFVSLLSNNKTVSTLPVKTSKLPIKDLFEAKINGNLDRIYAHKMSYEVSVIMNDETKLYNGSNDDALKAILSTSYTSLENLYNSISNFSEAK